MGSSGSQEKSREAHPQPGFFPTEATREAQDRAAKIISREETLTPVTIQYEPH